MTNKPNANQIHVELLIDARRLLDNYAKRPKKVSTCKRKQRSRTIYFEDYYVKDGVRYKYSKKQIEKQAKNVLKKREHERVG